MNHQNLKYTNYVKCLFLASALLAFVVSCGHEQVKRTAKKPIQSKTIVFVHGMFMTPLCFEEWQKYFESRGYKTISPAWPVAHDESPEILRSKHPNSELAKLTLTQVVDHYEKTIKGLNEKPILIGHSMGGLIVQILMERNLGVAGIAIDSAPPKGLLSFKWSFLKSNWGVISPFADDDEPILLTQSQFNYAWVHTFPENEQKEIYAKYLIPESRRVGKGPTTDEGKVDFSKVRGPILLVAGGDDQIIPPSLNYKNLLEYSKSPSITDFKEFPGRTHLILNKKGWEEVASYVLDWLQERQTKE